MSERSSVVYVYGVVPASLDVRNAPPGIDGARVELERVGALAALASRINGAAYAPDVIEQRVTDLAWLEPRARTHDEVLTWASDTDVVLPFPMFALFSDAARTADALRAREPELSQSIERVRGTREYGVRIFRVTRELEQHVGELSPRIAELERAARAATPGQRYLLERKLEKERSAEAHAISAEVVARALDALSVHARAAMTEPPPRRESGAGGAILNAFFLVESARLDAFRASISELAAQYEPRGFRFEFTGPWPAYHFSGSPQ